MPAKSRTPRKLSKAVAKPPLPMPNMEDFHTRARANEGQKIPLYAPDGRLTAHWLRVRGVDSDELRKAQTRQIRRTADILSLPEEEDREAALADAKLEMIASLVAEWSFDMPCTLDKVKAFLHEAPQIASEVERFASKRAFFFKVPSESLTPTPKPTSD